MIIKNRYYQCRWASRSEQSSSGYRIVWRWAGGGRDYSPGGWSSSLGKFSFARTIKCMRKTRKILKPFRALRINRMKRSVFSAGGSSVERKVKSKIELKEDDVVI